MSTAGPNAPGTMAQVSAGVTWSTIDNAKVSDDAYAYCSIFGNGLSHYLEATNFGFSIPSGATINGISVSLERKASVTGSVRYVRDSVVKLIKGGTASGDNKADTATKWTTSDSVITYGGSADLWGLTLTDTDINASNFGVRLQTNHTRTGGKGAELAYVDFISITIDYTTGGGGLSIPVAMQSYRRRRV